jgi:hypothetical protein
VCGCSLLVNTDGLSGGGADAPDGTSPVPDAASGEDAIDQGSAADATDAGSPDGSESGGGSSPGVDASDADTGSSDGTSPDSAAADAGDEDALTEDAIAADAVDAVVADSGGADSGVADSPSADSSADDGPPSMDSAAHDSSEVDSGPPVTLPRAGWVATASASLPTNPPAAAIDGVGTTRWTPGASQAAGQWFEVDMTVVQPFREITLDAGASWAADYVRGYQVVVSNDGASWSSPVATGVGASPAVTIDFATVSARYVRVVLTAASPTTHWWSIAELNVLN